MGGYALSLSSSLGHEAPGLGVMVWTIVVFLNMPWHLPPPPLLTAPSSGAPWPRSFCASPVRLAPTLVAAPRPQEKQQQQQRRDGDFIGGDGGRAATDNRDGATARRLFALRAAVARPTALHQLPQRVGQR